MKIYVDILFLENLILDFILLLTTSIICDKKRKFIRLLLGSTIGSLYTTMSFVFKFESITCNFLVSLIIIWISFKTKKMKCFIKHLLVFYLTLITFGGASLLFINSKKLINMLFFGFVTGFILMMTVKILFKKKFERICEIEINYNGKSVKTRALVDSRKFFKRKKF